MGVVKKDKIIYQNLIDYMEKDEEMEYKDFSKMIMLKDTRLLTTRLRGVKPFTIREINALIDYFGTPYEILFAVKEVPEEHLLVLERLIGEEFNYLLVKEAS